MTIPKDDIEKLIGAGSGLQRMAERLRDVTEPPWLKALQSSEIMTLAGKYEGMISKIADSPVMRAMQNHDAQMRSISAALSGPLFAINEKFSQSPFAKLAADLDKIQATF